MSKKLYLDNEYIRDVNTKFNYVSLINDLIKDPSYIHNVSDVESYSSADIDITDTDRTDTNNNEENLPGICIYDESLSFIHKYANDGTSIYHPVRRIGTNWYKLIPFGNIDIKSDTNSSSLENN